MQNGRKTSLYISPETENILRCGKYGGRNLAAAVRLTALRYYSLLAPAADMLYDLFTPEDILILRHIHKENSADILSGSNVLVSEISGSDLCPPKKDFYCRKIAEMTKLQTAALLEILENNM